MTKPHPDGAAVIQKLVMSIAGPDADGAFDLANVFTELRARRAAHEALGLAAEIAAPPTLMRPVHPQRETLKAHVRNRRLVLDAPMALPEGTLVDLFSLDDVLATGGYLLNEAELAALDGELDRELNASFEEEASGQLVDAEEALADLRASALLNGRPR